MHRSMVKWLILCPLLTFAQSSTNFHVDLFSTSPDSSVTSFRLSRSFVIASSIRVTVDSIETILFEYHQPTNSVLVDSSLLHTARQLAVAYRFIPLSLQPSYQLRSFSLKRDSSGRKQKTVSVSPSQGILNDMFGPELSKSGSISRGFFVGSNRDFTVSSGFRLQMAGKLSDDIDIVAALTDENTPIQPQGNTQTLQEIDNVFIEITSPTYAATLGDFQYNTSTSRLFSVSRKLQGARVIADYQTLNPKSRIEVTGATARGKYHSNRLQGIEGSQGPYRLSGKNNERNIIVIAGSEKVYVDGDLMIRGDNNDYSIDYGSAEIVFSARRLITLESRIVVDFEYTDRQYTRNVVGFNSTSEFGNSVTVKTNYFREGDDPDSPIDLLLSESDKNILQSAGNRQAFKDGVVAVGADSFGVGGGNYSAIDTVIGGVTFRIFRYETGTPRSLYNVSFSNLGQGKGDYVREGIGRYRFVGIKTGEYAPVILLSSPQLQQNYAFQSTFISGSTLTMDGEYAVSSYDRNRFSSLEDDLNAGQAFQLSLRYSPRDITLGELPIGSIEVMLLERFRDSRFTNLDRADEVEFGRKWSTDSLSVPSAVSEEIREASVVYTPINDLAFRTAAGTLHRGSIFNSARYDGGFDLHRHGIPKISYYAEFISGEDISSRTSNTWFRHKGSAEYTMYDITPSMRFEEEKRDVHLIGSDSAASPSFAFQSYSPKTLLSLFSAAEASAEYEWRSDDVADHGTIAKQSDAFTQQYAFTLREIHNFSFSSHLVLREKTYRPAFQATNTNQQTTLIKLQSRYRPLSQGIDIDLFYDVATQRTATLERVFFKVRKGEGQYIWSDANNNGIVDVNDEKEFRLDRYEGEYVAITLNSDILRPVINLKSSARLRISPQRFIVHPVSFLEKLMTSLSTETYTRLEERNTTTDIQNIYLLRFQSFLNPAFTVYGFQFVQQDLFLFENNTRYSFRFRFNQRAGLSQYSSGLERNYSRERSVRARFQVSNDISNQTDVVFKNDNAVSSSLLNQSRRISSALFGTDLSYRPETNVEIGFKLENSQSEDKPFLIPVTADFNAQTVRFVYGFQGNGQIRAEVSREEIILSSTPANYILPYEMTGGRETGRQFHWSVGSEYRFGGNVQFSLQYFGRTSTAASVVHNGKMEVRAFF